MRNRRFAILGLIRAAAAVLAIVMLGALPPFAAPAFAGELDDAKSAGYVGERPDGYLGLVDPGAPASARQLVDDINARRRAHYASIAEKTGSNVRAVGILAGEKLIANAAPGTFVMDSAGRWQRK
jgi:uncharacterized protein YdbL (DUF1318 family)